MTSLSYTHIRPPYGTNVCGISAPLRASPPRRGGEQTKTPETTIKPRYNQPTADAATATAVAAACRKTVIPHVFSVIIPQESPTIMSPTEMFVLVLISEAAYRCVPPPLLKTQRIMLLSQRQPTPRHKRTAIACPVREKESLVLGRLHRKERAPVSHGIENRTVFSLLDSYHPRKHSNFKAKNSASNQSVAAP